MPLKYIFSYFNFAGPTRKGYFSGNKERRNVRTYKDCFLFLEIKKCVLFLDLLHRSVVI